MPLSRTIKPTGADTPVHPASDVKNQWSRIVDEAKRHGEVIVTHHRHPQVVVMDVDAYTELVNRAEAANPLRDLRAAFDRRFAKLNSKAGDAKLRAAAAAGIPAPASAKRGKHTRHS